MWGAPIEQNFKNNYRPQGNFRYNNQNNVQGNSDYFPRYQNQRYHDQRYQSQRYQDAGYQFQRYQNPRYENLSFRNNFNHNNNHNHNNKNFRPPNQNSHRNYNNLDQNGNSFRPNYPNGRNFQNNVMNTQSFPAIMPNSENPEIVQFIDKKEYEEFLQFKLQKKKLVENSDSFCVTNREINKSQKPKRIYSFNIESSPMSIHFTNIYYGILGRDVMYPLKSVINNI